MSRRNMRGAVGPLIKGMVFAVTTALATTVLGVTIANTGVDRTVSYSARFTDVTSLNSGDEVRMSGVRIGQVDEVEVVDRRLAEVTFSVRADRSISATAGAAVRYRNMVGQRYIAIVQDGSSVDEVSEDGTGSATGDGDTARDGDTSGDTGDSAEKSLRPGATIPLERTSPALDLTALFNGFKPLFQAMSPKQVNKLSAELVQVLQGQGATVDGLVRHTGSLTSTLAKRDKLIGDVIENLNDMLRTFNERDEQFGRLIDTTQKLVSGLAKDAKPIGRAIGGLGELSDSMAGLLREGRGPLRDGIKQLGRLSKGLADNTPVFEKFLNNLPQKYDRIGTLASYGSWFNFYLCSATSDAPRPPGGPPVGIPVSQPRCQG